MSYWFPHFRKVGYGKGFPTGYGKVTIAISFLKQLTLSDRKMLQKLWSMLLYDIKDQLYECTIYETFDNTITRYKGNSVYDNTLFRMTSFHERVDEIAMNGEWRWVGNPNNRLLNWNNERKDEHAFELRKQLCKTTHCLGHNFSLYSFACSWKRPKFAVSNEQWGFFVFF